MAPLANTLTTLVARASGPSSSVLSKRYYYYSTYYFPVGAIVGIVIVCIIIFLMIIGICVRRSRRNRGAVPYQPQPWRAGGAPGAVGANQTNYGNNGYPTGQYQSQYAQPVPSQYGNPQQTEFGNTPKYGDNNGPIQGVPPVYSGPGTFYGNTHNTNNDQTGIVR